MLIDGDSYRSNHYFRISKFQDLGFIINPEDDRTTNFSPLSLAAGKPHLFAEPFNLFVKKLNLLR
jgi:hypothetical protein